MRKEYKKYLYPRDVDFKHSETEEIISHSSMLTNKRLDILFFKLDEIRFEAWTNICVPTVKEYFSLLSGIYNNVFPIFSLEENTKVKEYFDKFHEKFSLVFIKDVEINRYQLLYACLMILDHIQRLLIGFLQARQFFFRFGRSQIKGIKQALDLYEKGTKRI